MNSRTERQAYEIIKASAEVAADELDRILKESEAGPLSFSQALVQSGLLHESRMLELYSGSLGVPYVHLKSMEVDKAVFTRVSAKFAWYYRFFPLSLYGEKLKIVVSRLLDLPMIDEIRVGLGMDIEICLAQEAEIVEMLKKHYGLGAETVDRILTQSSRTPLAETHSLTSGTEVEDIEKLAETASVVQLVNQILLDAYHKKASDIHLEPFRGKVRLRYRIDGVLQEAAVPAEMKKFFDSILSRIKIMANLNIVEKRLPQDGKARVKTHDQTLDLRVSSIPTPHGESMVIRILPSKMIRRLDELGLDDEQCRSFRDLMRRTYGIIFVTGPTGSGKSTTLYAGMSLLNTEDRKIITIEDPVEYELEGVTQIQVVPEIGLTFARGLRSVLRHDPDVMMVGEVRDLETADIAIRVALTGHLILSTLHTNDAASGVTRLLDIGVKPYLVSSSVIAFIAQRLVRVICPHCKEKAKHVLPEMKQLIVRELGMAGDGDIAVYSGKGCDHCNHTGFSGRIAICETLLVNEEIRKMIFAKMPAEEIKQKARAYGMRTLRQDGWLKVLAGVTTPEEILQVTPADDSVDSNPGIGKSAVRSDGTGAQAKVPEAHGETPVFKEGTTIPIYSDEKVMKKVVTSRGAFIDRRAYERMKVKLPIVYGIIDFDEVDAKVYGGKAEAGQDLKYAQTDDISANGLAFMTHQSFEVGSTLDLKIEIPDGQSVIQCLSRVVRNTPMDQNSDSPGSSFNTIGVTFLAINSTDRARIEKFCHETPKA